MDLFKYGSKEYERDRARINRRLQEINRKKAWYRKDNHWVLFHACERTGRDLIAHNRFLRELAEINEEAANLNALDQTAPSPETIKAAATPEADDEALDETVDVFALAGNPDRATEPDPTPESRPGQEWLAQWLEEFEGVKDE